MYLIASIINVLQYFLIFCNTFQNSNGELQTQLSDAGAVYWRITKEAEKLTAENEVQRQTVRINETQILQLKNSIMQLQAQVVEQQVWCYFISKINSPVDWVAFLTISEKYILCFEFFCIR